MISQVTFWVEHGEDSETLEAWMDYASNLPTDHKVEVLETDFIVDVPSPIRKWFVNEEGNTYDYLPAHQSDHFPNDFHTPFDTEVQAQVFAESLD